MHLHQSGPPLSRKACYFFNCIVCAISLSVSQAHLCAPAATENMILTTRDKFVDTYSESKSIQVHYKCTFILVSWVLYARTAYPEWWPSGNSCSNLLPAVCISKPKSAIVNQSLQDWLYLFLTNGNPSCRPTVKSSSLKWILHFRFFLQ